MNASSSTVPLIVVMGVSGSGKSTIGALLADRLAVPFIDADALHPLENVEKMSLGVPLTDDERWAWLADIGLKLASAEAGLGMVIACSALKRSYRYAILAEVPAALFVHLSSGNEVLLSRLEGRSGHYMPATLLESQLADLEPLAADEPGVVVDVSPDVPAILEDAIVQIRSYRTVASNSS